MFNKSIRQYGNTKGGVMKKLLVITAILMSMMLPALALAGGASTA